MLDAVLLALALAPQLEAQTAEEPRAGRPAAPYSRPPVSGRARPGHPRRSVAGPGAPAAAPESVAFADDGVPLPVPAVVRAGSEGDVEDARAGGDPHFLGFAAGPHFPPEGELVDARLQASALSSFADGRPSPDTYAFVMFAKRMTPERLAQLEALGCRTLGFHPHYTQRVALPAAALAHVAALDFVRWIGVPRPWQKVHPTLQRHLAQASPNQPVDVWVSVFESDLNAASEAVEAPLVSSATPTGSVSPEEPDALRHLFVSNGWQQRALELAGLDVLAFHDRAKVFRARMMPQGLDLVTGLDFVQFVELDKLMRPFHDQSTPMINADDTRSFYSGSDTAIAGIADTGVNAGHTDLSFYMIYSNFSGTPGTVWEDLCGHGTHVAGTILGDGTTDPSHRGVAPGLGSDFDRPVYNARLFTNCDPQGVDEVVLIDFMTPATKKPHVVNNSWGADPVAGSPWIGSEAEVRLFDDAAYYDAQLWVFAAGNGGPTASTIALPAVAKNVLAVGNVTDYDTSLTSEIGAGELWNGSFGSARGPCGDGRWKPNVAAPGRWVTSTSAFVSNAYSTLYGTSMAAPHVTGLVAGLIDSDPDLAYLPEAVSSLLMATASRKNGAGIASPGDPALDTYGAGRVDGTTAIWDSSKGTRSQWKFSLAPNVSTYAAFDVPAGATRLVAVMHYVEPSASAGASTALVNDFDLWLDQPPLTPNSNTGEWYAQQSSVDNTEIRALNNPIEGTWNWKVHPTSTTGSAYFGVTIFVETGATSPSIAPTITAPECAQRHEVVRFDYSLTTGGMPLSGVFLETSVSPGATLHAAHTYLRDGPETDLMSNSHQGWDMTLGNVHPFFGRSAAWELSWDFDGYRTLCVITHSDNASNPGDVECKTVIIDSRDPEITSLSSTSHGSGWSSDPTADIVWTADDPLYNGVASGVDGLGHSVTPDNLAVPAKTVTLGAAATALTTPSLSDGVHWFNIRAVDKAGNWGYVKNLELKIDTQAPGAITGLGSSTHQAGVSSCDSTITVDWDAATDALSGVAGYGVAFTFGAGGTAPTVINAPSPTFTFTLPSSTLPWYCHVRAIDAAGNAGPTSTIGPFPIDADPAYAYCTAKTNSQGCVPTMTWSGQPTLSDSTFTAIGAGVLNNKVGLLFWGTTPSATPFQGGTKCVAAPTVRTPTQNSGGTPPPDDCSGTYSFSFDSAYMNAQGIGVGDTIYCQYWSRDPTAAWTTGLTDGLSFTVCP